MTDTKSSSPEQGDTQQTEISRLAAVNSLEVGKDNAVPPRQRHRPQMKDTTKPYNPNEIIVFNFRTNWDLVLPHLEHPSVVGALNRGLRALLKFKGLATGEKLIYDPSAGPWSYTEGDVWHNQASFLAQHDIDMGYFDWKFSPGDVLPEEDKNRKIRLLKGHYPQPGTYRWYQCYGACHFLAPWQQALGKRMLPNLQWRRMARMHHALAYGADRMGNICMILDILNFDRLTAPQLIEFATRSSESPCCADCLKRNTEKPLINQAPEPSHALTE